MHDSTSEPPTRFWSPRLTRRRLLAATLGGAAALLAQACGRSTPNPGPAATPTASPSPSVTPRPAATGTLMPGVTASATPEGSALHLPLVTEAEPTPTNTVTVTPTPEPTEPPVTPQPTATPRPPATPFPPGPATKLGIFLGYQHPMLEELLQTGNLPFVKTLEYDPNLMAHIKQVSPGTLLVARYTPLGQLDVAAMDPIAEARRFVELLLPIATEPQRLANIDAWEAYNEPVVKTRDEMQRLATFEAERTRLLAAHGVRSCVGNFASGNPPLELWPDFFPALQAVQETGGFLGLHEYSAPTMWFSTGPYQLEPGRDEGDEGWLTLRYRKAYRQYLIPNGLAVPLLITETGIDGGVTERPGPPGFGWQDFVAYWEAEGLVRTSAAGFYLEQLAWYDAELQQDEFVRGASIFAFAAPVGWASFELLGQAAELYLQYVSVHPRR